MNHCRCCSKLEEIALSPRVGRLFIIIAITLITIGTITYFNVIFPTTLNTPSSLLFSIYLTICTTTHYYWACTTQPGSPATEPPPPHHHLIQRHCPKCLKRGITPPLKPERAHHCRHCGQCQLKYDHHCPWINQCVGLRNERFFLLFLFYLSISCAWIVYWGWPCFTDTFDFTTPWPFWSPRIFMILTWVLALAIGVAIAIMFGWQLWLVAKGETTVESSDNEYYRTLFSQRGQVSKQLSNPVLKERRDKPEGRRWLQKYVHPYDLGVRKNLQEFFNIGPLPGRWPWYSVLIPLKIPPVSDGWRWNKRPLRPDAQQLSFAEELTDEED